MIPLKKQNLERSGCLAQGKRTNGRRLEGLDEIAAAKLWQNVNMMLAGHVLVGRKNKAGRFGNRAGNLEPGRVQI